MADDLCLLLDTISSERLAGFERIAIAAKWVAHQRKIPTALALRLPHMRHFVDEMALQVQRGTGEIVAIQVTMGVEPQMPIGGHRHLARMEWPPFRMIDPHRIIIDCVAEHDRSEFALGIA